jgi:hypothetical protein
LEGKVSRIQQIAGIASKPTAPKKSPFPSSSNLPKADQAMLGNLTQQLEEGLPGDALSLLPAARIMLRTGGGGLQDLQGYNDFYRSTPLMRLPSPQEKIPIVNFPQPILPRNSSTVRPFCRARHLLDGVEGA